MEQRIRIKNEYNSLEKIEELVKKESSFEVSQQYDSWEVRQDANGQMEKCLVIKKSNMHGVRLYFVEENVLKLNYVIPSKVMNSFFGENKERRKNILEIIGGVIRSALLASSQKKAFDEISAVFNKIVVV